MGPADWQVSFSRNLHCKIYKALQDMVASEINRESTGHVRRAPSHKFISVSIDEYSQFSSCQQYLKIVQLLKNCTKTSKGSFPRVVTFSRYIELPFQVGFLIASKSFNK